MKKKICPYCVERVEQFEEREKDGQPVLQCPHPNCNAVIPPTYITDTSARPVLVSLIGLKSHGKTVYLSGLLRALYDPPAKWGKNYSCTAVDTAGMVNLETSLQELRQGKLPEPTQGFTRPAIHRLRGVAWAKNCWLLMYDVAGETFMHKPDEQKYFGYAIHSPVVMTLLSLADLETPEEPQKILVRYRDILASKQVSPKDRDLLVVLTKGDMIRDWDGLPEVVQRYLDGEEDPLDGGGFERLEEISAALEKWMEGGGPRKFDLFVRQARQELGTVKYCVVSALGTEPNEASKSLHVSVVPRGILIPLYWLWGLQDAPSITLNGRRYCSLEWAVAQAREGDTIHLGPGTHPLHRPLHIRCSLRLVGAGRKETRVVARTGDQVVLYDGAGALHTENIHFAYGGKLPANVCRVHCGTARFRACAFTGAVRADDEGGAGLILDGITEAEVSDCVLQHNGAYGILVLDQAHAVLTGNRCDNNQYGGIGFFGASAGGAWDNHCKKNRYGIYVCQEAAPLLEQDECAENLASGICYAGSSAGQARTNTCRDNGEHGIHVSHKSHPAIEDNRCYGNKQFGLKIGRSASPTVGENQLDGNVAGAIWDQQSS